MNQEKQDTQYWEKINKLYESSKMSQRTFCEKYNVSRIKLKNFRYKIKRQQSTPELKPIKITKLSEFDIPNNIEMKLPNGVVLRFEQITYVELITMFGILKDVDFSKKDKSLSV